MYVIGVLKVMCFWFFNNFFYVCVFFFDVKKMKIFYLCFMILIWLLIFLMRVERKEKNYRKFNVGKNKIIIGKYNDSLKKWLRYKIEYDRIVLKFLLMVLCVD